MYVLLREKVATLMPPEANSGTHILCPRPVKLSRIQDRRFSDTILANEFCLQLIKGE